MELSIKVPFKNVYFNVIVELPSWNEVKRLVTILTAKVQAVALETIAAACSRLGQRDWGSSLRFKARKIRALYIQPNTFAPPPLPVLVGTKNVAKREVIIRGEDSKAIALMKERVIAEHPDSEIAKCLQKSRCRGAHFDGICTGAVQLLIKECLRTPPTSLQELIDIVKKFEYGFDAEAEALQALHKKSRFLFKTISSDLNTAQEKITKAYHETPDQLKPTVEPDTLASLNMALASYYENHFQLENGLLKLSGLKIINQSEKLPEFYIRGPHVREESARSRFESFPEGTHLLKLKTPSGAHAVAYLKYGFGCYFVDPNYGLMTTGNKTAFDALLTLLKSYGNTNRDVEPFFLGLQ